MASFIGYAASLHVHASLAAAEIEGKRAEMQGDGNLAHKVDVITAMMITST